MRNRYGTIATILGLIGLCIPLGLILGPLAIIFGRIGIKKDEENAVAIIGFILGIIVTFFNIIGIVLLIIFFISLGFIDIG